MKRSSKILGVVVIAGFLGAFAVVYIASEVRWAAVNDPGGKFINVQEYLAHGRLPERVQRIEKKGSTYFIAYGPMDYGLAVPSGPAAYVFEESGALVDWSSDIGDDPGFTAEWPTGSAQSVSLDELKMLASTRDSAAGKGKSGD